MADEPVSAYPTREQLVERLVAAAPQLKKKAFSSLYGFDMDDVICAAVEANTIRGFNQKKLGLKESPMNVYRDWASDFVMWLGYADFQEVSDREAFEAFHRKARVSVEKAFLKAGANAAITFGQSTKLVDLLFKKLVRFHEISDANRTRLSEFLHVPLEKYNLLAIRDMNVRGRDGAKLALPKSASVQFLTTEETYLGIQDHFAAIAKDAEMPPILLDYLLWDIQHGA